VQELICTLMYIYLLNTFLLRMMHRQWYKTHSAQWSDSLHFPHPALFILQVCLGSHWVTTKWGTLYWCRLHPMRVFICLSLQFCMFWKKQRDSLTSTWSWHSLLPCVTVQRIYFSFPNVVQMEHDQMDTLKHYWSILQQSFF